MIFVSIIFCFEKHGILWKLFFDKICSRIHKNKFTCKFCTILEWDKCQSFADFVKFVVFWFVLTQLYKTSVKVFLDRTLVGQKRYGTCRIEGYSIDYKSSFKQHFFSWKVRAKLSVISLWGHSHTTVHWFGLENQQRHVYLVNWHFSGHPDRC